MNSNKPPEWLVDKTRDATEWLAHITLCDRPHSELLHYAHLYGAVLAHYHRLAEDFWREKHVCSSV